MSVDFYVTEAGSRVEKVSCTATLSNECSPEHRCGFCDDGVETVDKFDVQPVNARGLLSLLELSAGDSGDVMADEVSDLRERVKRLRERVCESFTLRKLERFDHLLSEAQRLGSGIYWA